MAEPEAGDGRLGSPRPALPPKVAESLDNAMLEKTLRPVLVEKKEQLVLLEERGMMLLSRGSRSRRFDLVRCLEDKGLFEEESDGVGAGGRRLPLGSGALDLTVTITFKGTFSARGYRLGRLAVHFIAP